MKYKVLFNPIAGNVEDVGFFVDLKETLKGDELTFVDLTTVDYVELLTGESDEGVIIAGGDGTLNRFINVTAGMEIKRPVLFYAAGNGNDFWTDIGRNIGDAPIDIAPYIKDLPTVEVNGKTSKFINGVGFGIDGYCCEVGDKLRAKGKKVNYTSIAVKGCLFTFKPKNATVTVDGKKYYFKKVWIAPTMNGRMYGGGMLPTPSQDRLNEARTVSLCVFHGAGRLKTLILFPSLFKGEHVNKKKNTVILQGHEINVRFSQPCPLQIDGETVLNVTEYTVRSAK